MGRELDGRMQRVGTFLSEEQCRQVARLADLRQVRPATIVRDAVRAYLALSDIREELREVAA